MIVVDSSAAIDYLAGEERGAWVAERLLVSGDLHAPHLFDLEVVGGLRRLVLRGLEAYAAARATVELAVLPLARHAHVPLLPRIWELRHNITPYDAAYVALAEALGAPLLTTDLRLARTPGLPVDVIAP